MKLSAVDYPYDQVAKLIIMLDSWFPIHLGQLVCFVC